MELPVIGVLSDKRHQGANHPNDEVPPLICLPFAEAMRRRWQTDAHFLQYTALNTGMPTWPRCNKAILPHVRKAGADLVATILALDYDNPPDAQGHAVWTQASISTWFAALDDVCAKFPVAADYAILYTTRGGARLVYVLEEPVPVDQFEGRAQWFAQQFVNAGMKVDLSVSDWTRVFRLPYVMRNGRPTWEDEWCEYSEQLDKRIDIRGWPEATRPKQSEYGIIKPFVDPKPAIDEALSCVQRMNPEGRQVETEWYKAAKKRLKGRECWPCLFDHQKIAEKGNRNNTLHEFVGQAIALLYYMDHTTPIHVYGLFLDPVLQLQNDQGTNDWTDVLWDQIGRLWSKEEAKVTDVDAKKDEEANQALQQVASIADCMKAWCSHPALHRAEDPMRWIGRHLIVSIANTYHVMQPNGYYDEVPLQGQQVIPRIRILGMDHLIDTTTIGDNGDLKDRSLKSILDEHATIVTAVEAVPQIDGAFIRNIDLGNSTLVFPAYRRNPNLRGKYDRDVDEWLRALFGKHFNKAMQWLAWAPAFDEGPICAMSIKGGAGIGKKLLSRGLSETLESPSIATEADIITDYQYGLLKSPYLLINEGWPTGRVGGMHPADTFRRYVGGDGIPIQRKYMPPAALKSPIRVIFTANNFDALRVLCHGKNLSPEDREALAVRLMHFDVEDGGAEYLKAMGGLAFTGSKGRRWVAGDGSHESDYIVAQHILWLYENRKGPLGSRFLVEGNANEEIISFMRTQAGHAPIVIEAVIKMLESQKNRDGLALYEGKLFILGSEILEFYRANLAQSSREVLTANSIAEVLRGLIVKEHKSAFEIPTKPGRKRWYELDCSQLLMVAQRDGLKCKMLERLVDEQNAERLRLSKVEVARK